MNYLISTYNQKAISGRDDLASKTLTFIKERMYKIEKELNELEYSIQRFGFEKGVVNLSEQERLYLKDIGEYDCQKAGINRQLSILSKMDQYVVLEKNQTELARSTLGVEDPVLTQLLETPLRFGNRI